MRNPDKRFKNRRVPAIVGGIVGVVCLGLVGVGAVLLDRQMTKQAVESDTTVTDEAHQTYAKGSIVLNNTVYEYYHNFENYLFIGTDGSGNEDPENYQNPESDFLMLLSVDRTADSYSIIELERDTMTSVEMINGSGNSTGSEVMQLGKAQSYGSTVKQGSTNQVNAISKLLGGMKINGFVTLSIDKLSEFNQITGGVTLTLLDDFSKEDPEMKKGATLTLTDEQAYIYLRPREDGEEEPGERRERQHQYLMAFIEQGINGVSASTSYFQKVFDVIDTVTTSDLTTQQFTRIATALGTYESKGVLTPEGTTQTGANGNEFIIDSASLVEVLTTVFELQAVRELPTELVTEAETPEPETETETETEEMTEPMRYFAPW